MQLETEPERAPAAERLDVVGMERAGPGAGIDLCLDGADAKIGQPDPFAPADLSGSFGVRRASMRVARDVASASFNLTALAQRMTVGFASMGERHRL
jgi:hypothetical protein